MRDITKCHPRLRQLAKELVVECQKKGLSIKLTECLRTVEEQNDLYAKGRTKPGSIVTNAKGTSYSSMHQWGVAFDICRNDGKGAYYDSDGFFTKVGKIGMQLGLEWGGSWTSPVDKPHFQLKDWGSTSSKLKAQYKTPANFMKTWKKEDDEMVENSKIIVDGKTIPVKRIMKDGTNYIKLRDVADALGYKISNAGNVARLDKK